MDPLSDVLSLLKPRKYMYGGLDLAGKWSFQWPSFEGVKCYAVISGEMWICVEGIQEPIHLTAGDCCLLPSNRPFILTSDVSLTPFDFRMIITTPLNGGIRTFNGGGDCFGLGGFFELSGKSAELLLELLPPVVHIKTESDKAAIRWFIERFMQELRDPQPGGSLVAEHLTQMMLVQALRLYLAEIAHTGGTGNGGNIGWLYALGDKQMSIAIGCIHSEPSHQWSLQELAERSGMSRSSFASKFKETVGTPPMDYLTKWRMMLATDKLINSRDSISVIADSLGYESVSAFSAAFKRIIGTSPRQYERKSIL